MIVAGVVPFGKKKTAKGHTCQTDKMTWSQKNDNTARIFVDYWVQYENVKAHALAKQMFEAVRGCGDLVPMYAVAWGEDVFDEAYATLCWWCKKYHGSKVATYGGLAKKTGESPWYIKYHPRQCYYEQKRDCWEENGACKGWTWWWCSSWYKETKCGNYYQACGMGYNTEYKVEMYSYRK